mgnify:CR=1 FL=1
MCSSDLERGLPTVDEVTIPAKGLTATALAEQLDLPLDLIEGVFCNRTVYPMRHLIAPGDRVAADAMSNLIIHALNVLLLFAFLRISTGKTIASFFVALFFLRSIP